MDKNYKTKHYHSRIIVINIVVMMIKEICVTSLQEVALGGLVTMMILRIHWQYCCISLAKNNISSEVLLHFSNLHGRNVNYTTTTSCIEWSC